MKCFTALIKRSVDIFTFSMLEFKKNLKANVVNFFVYMTIMTFSTVMQSVISSVNNLKWPNPFQ